MANKSDDRNLLGKLDLRRHFLRKYYADGSARVMDCCSSSGRVWGQLRREFIVASYWATGTKRSPGRTKIDTSKILAQPGWSENVIDLDANAWPWLHWQSLLPNASGPTTVFITLGRGGHNRIRLRAADLLLIGLTPSMIEKLSGSITCSLLDLSIRRWLALVPRPLSIVEATEAQCVGNIRCLGVRLEMKPAHAST